MYAARSEYLDYKMARAEWEKTNGEKVTDSMSIRYRLRQKKQIVKEREAVKDYLTRSKEKGAR